MKHLNATKIQNQEIHVCKWVNAFFHVTRFSLRKKKTMAKAETCQLDQVHLRSAHGLIHVRIPHPERRQHITLFR